jgi:hypothetical protein
VSGPYRKGGVDMKKEKIHEQIVKELRPHDNLDPELKKILNEVRARMNRSNIRMKRFMEGLEPGSITKEEMKELIKESIEDVEKCNDMMKRLRRYKKKKA